MSRESVLRLHQPSDRHGIGDSNSFSGCAVVMKTGLSRVAAQGAVPFIGHCCIQRRHTNWHLPAAAAHYHRCKCRVLLRVSKLSHILTQRAMRHGSPEGEDRCRQTGIKRYRARCNCGGRKQALRGKQDAPAHEQRRSANAWEAQTKQHQRELTEAQKRVRHHRARGGGCRDSTTLQTASPEAASCLDRTWAVPQRRLKQPQVPQRAPHLRGGEVCERKTCLRSAVVGCGCDFVACARLA